MASSRIVPSCLVPPALPWKRAAARQFPATRAKKEEEDAGGGGGGGGAQAEKSTTRAFSLSSTASTLARPALAVFALGFLDAGYSGDWSRIGAISKATEEFLKIAAYFVIPSCLLLIYFISDGKKHSVKE